MSEPLPPLTEAELESIHSISANWITTNYGKSLVLRLRADLLAARAEVEETYVTLERLEEALEEAQRSRHESSLSWRAAAAERNQARLRIAYLEAGLRMLSEVTLQRGWTDQHTRERIAEILAGTWTPKEDKPCD